MQSRRNYSAARVVYTFPRASYFSDQGFIYLTKLHNFIHDNTAPDTEAIYTDEVPAYRGVEDADTKHKRVNHYAEEWVAGDVYTNGIESVWSLLKRSIIGSYHKVSIAHLDAYLDELEHRFNNRKNEHIFRDSLSKLVNAAKLLYQDLVRKAA